MTRRPGQWPVDEPADLDDDPDPQGTQHLAVVRERARFEVTLGAVRADLEEQPSARSVRAAVRRWHRAITQLGDEVIAERHKRAG